MRGRVAVYHPSNGFRFVSVTGKACALQCDHCRGHFLCGMEDASRPGMITDIGESILTEGKVGMLVSGGCDKDGAVPLSDRINELGSLSAKGVLLNVHTGLLDEEGAKGLARCGAARYSMDLHRSEKVVREVLHIRSGIEPFERTLKALCDTMPGKVTPHICAGLNGDDIRFEIEAVDLAAREGAAAIILLRHMPTDAAPLRPEPPLSDESFLRLVEHAVRRSPRPVLLGCMRPRGKLEHDLACIEAGLAGVASPSPQLVRRLRQLGHQVEEHNVCCALHL